MNKPTPPADSMRPFAGRVLVGAAVVIGLLLLVVLLWYAVNVLLLAFAGVLLAILLRAPADWLAGRTRLSERASLAIVIIAVLGAMAGAGVLVAPQVVEQSEQLVERLPQSLEQMRAWLVQYPLGRWLVDTIPDLEDGLGDMLVRGVGMFYTTVGVLVGILVALFMMIYLAVNPRMYMNGVLHMVPFSARPRAAEIIAATGYTLRWWLIGSLIRMAAVGLMTFVGLWLLGVPLPFLLALLAFVLDFVPYFGPIIAAVPAVLLAFVAGPEQALYVVILYFIVQQIESLLLSPLLYHKTVYLPPVVTILAQMLLGILAGPLGLVLATPLTAAVLVWVKMLYVEQTLGDYQIHRPEVDLDPDDIPQIPGQGERADPPHARGDGPHAPPRRIAGAEVRSVVDE